ncbi:MAG: nuclear transport factor 2 family protein [Vulcanimicrobiaceae bacterium]
MWFPEIAALLDMTDGDVAMMANVHDPQAGDVRGSAFSALVRESKAWFLAHRARTRGLATLLGKSRIVAEYVVDFERGGESLDLPVAVVVDKGRDLLDVRIYHSHYPLLSTHVVRAPIVQPDVRVNPSGIVDEYLNAFSAGDAERVVEAFELDGYVREPSGARYTHRGRDVLLPFYRFFFSAGGGIPLRHCTVTEDAKTSALEYVCDRWGSHDLAPQAGVAIYTRGPNGLIASAHVYDDVRCPLD